MSTHHLDAAPGYLGGDTPRVALVTGAGRGIGKALALGLGRRGCAVWCISRTLDQVQETAKEIDALGGTGIARSADVTKDEEMQALGREVIQESGKLDILVANAGGNQDRRPIEQSDPAAFRATIETNLFGVYSTVRGALPALRAAGGGHIVVMGSGIGIRGLPNTGAYAASKAGVRIFAHVISGELAGEGIAVNELIPGPVKTDLTRPLWEAKKGAFGIEGEWIKEPEDVVPYFLGIVDRDPKHSPSGQTFCLARRVL
jgi:3-oxoacyl-[acyl-carrier protein] reductase